MSPFQSACSWRKRRAYNNISLAAFVENKYYSVVKTMLCLLHQDKKLREAFAVFPLVKFPALYPSGDIILDYTLLVVYTHLVQRLLSGTLLRSSSPNINVGSDKDMLSIQNINPLPKFFKTVVICRRS